MPVDYTQFNLFQLEEIPRRYNPDKDIHDDKVYVSWAEMRLYMALQSAFQEINTLSKEISGLKKQLESIQETVWDLKLHSDTSEEEHDYQ